MSVLPRNRFGCLLEAWTVFVLAFPNLLLATLAVDVAIPQRLALCGASLALLALSRMTLPSRAFLWASIPLFFLVPFESFHILVLRCASTTGMIGSLLETDGLEVRDVAGSLILPALVALALPGSHLAALLLTRNRPSSKPALPAKRRIIATVLVSAFAFFLLHASCAEPRTGLPLPRAFQNTFPFGTLEKIAQFGLDRIRQHQAESATRSFRWKATRSDASDPRETYVLVIGETSRAGNWSLYGYDRPTTPRLDGISDILRFANATSAANLTEIAIPFLLTTSTPERPYAADSSTSILACFREAGFKTWWISTQCRSGRQASRIGRIVDDAHIRQFLTDPIQGSRPFDQSLLPALDEALADTSRRKLVVLHTLGSHHAYANRYPAAFAKFQGRQELATYDNSILYTDHVLDQILSRLRKAPGAKAFLYLSDHGEALGENGLHNHGRAHPVRAEVEIPFLVWISPELDSLRPSLLANLRARQHDRIWSPDLGPTLLSLAGIRSPHLDRSRSLADNAYREHVRWILSPQGDLVDADALAGSSFQRSPPPR